MFTSEMINLLCFAPEGSFPLLGMSLSQLNGSVLSDYSWLNIHGIREQLRG